MSRQSSRRFGQWGQISGWSTASSWKDLSQRVPATWVVLDSPVLAALTSDGLGGLAG
ncbi:hypothetical protein ACFVFD_00120 [Streptomyces fimicarius]|uniref:hypothetical protein n=1 Tax=Streptomyces griseus TaxID=1911 RepID=UPI003691E811